MRTHAQGRAAVQRHAARRGDLDDDTADRASPSDPRRRGLSAEPLPLTTSLAPAVEPQVTDEMIARMAKRLWEARGGNAVLNWIEAEQALQDLVRHAPVYPLESPTSRTPPRTGARAIATSFNSACS